MYIAFFILLFIESLPDILLETASSCQQLEQTDKRRAGERSLEEVLELM